VGSETSLSPVDPAGLLFPTTVLLLILTLRLVGMRLRFKHAGEVLGLVTAAPNA